MISAAVMVASALHTVAYIDPSVVTYIISVVSGILIAGGAGVAIYWKRIKLYFKKKKEKSSMSNTSAEPSSAASVQNNSKAASQNENLAD